MPGDGQCSRGLSKCAPLGRERPHTHSRFWPQRCRSLSALFCMSKPVEVPDAEWVQLRPCEGGQLLGHIGTGETCLIQKQCSLQIREGNAALVWREDNSEVSSWACDFFLMALLRAPREPGGSA